MIALLKLVWSFPSCIARNLYGLAHMLFIVLTSVHLLGSPAMELGVVIRILRLISTRKPTTFYVDKGDRLEFGIEFEVSVINEDKGE